MSRVFDFTSILDASKAPAGWYQEKNSPNSQASLLVNSSNHNIPGIIRFNETESKFQGFNGNTWVTFNSTKGDKGDKGTDFNSIVNLINIGGIGAADGVGQLLISSKLDTTTDPNIRCRSLVGAKAEINGEMFSTMNIVTMKDTVILSPVPQPMIWNCSNTKILADDGTLCAYGDVSIWKIVPGVRITRGQAVRITGETGQYLEPLVYKMPINPFKQNVAFFGIALEDGMDTEIRVCTRGITAVKLSNELPKEFINSMELRDCGLPGIVAPDGFLFNSPTKPMSEFYVQAGVFLVKGNIKEVADTNGGFVKFKI